MSDTIFNSPVSIDPQSGAVSYVDDNRLVVRFFRGQEIHGLQSQEAGRPIYVGVDMVEIRQPGERDIFHGMATELHKARFPRQWEAYQNGREHEPDGTPLSVLFPTEPDTVANLRHFKIHTLEQLAGLQESAINRIGMGARNWVNKAQKFMQAATGYQAASQMNRQVNDLTAENDALKAQMQQMAEAIAALQADKGDEQRRGPGRPRKVEAEENAT